MAIAFRVSQFAFSVSGSLDDVIDVPSTSVANLDYVIGAWFSGRTLSSAPSGWTQLSASFNFDGKNAALHGHYGTGSEPSTYDWTQPTNDDGGQVALGAFSGVDQTTPTEGLTENSVGAASATTNDITPSMDGCVDVLIFRDAEGTGGITTEPAGYTQLITPSLNFQFVSFAAYYKILGAGTSGVAQGAKTLVWNAGTAFTRCTRFLIRPAAATTSAIARRAFPASILQH